MKITTQFNGLFKIQPVILGLFFKYSLATINSQLIPIKSAKQPILWETSV
jgi:hypothetical protein